MRKFLAVTVCAVMIFAGYLAMTTNTNSTTQVPVAEATAAHPSYTGVIYVAGMGGHFSKAMVEINPAETQPINIKSLDRVVIGNKNSHPTHDPRIDSENKDVLYWSTYKIDKEIGVDKRKVHVGKSNLKTGDVMVDKTVELDPKAEWTGAIYCASGQSEDYYMPVTMTDLPYIDVYAKDTMELKHRVFLEQYDKGETFFFHGTNSPDMKKFALAVNMADDHKPNGNIQMLMLDLKALEKGEAKVLASNKVTGSPGKTLTFRQSFTPDGKYVLQSGADRFYLLRGDNLDLVDEELLDAANHDAIPTPDGKYAILTMRKNIATVAAPEGNAITDGHLALYDIENRTVVGQSSSVCYDCHKDMGLHGNAILCGADGDLSM